MENQTYTDKALVLCDKIFDLFNEAIEIIDLVTDIWLIKVIYFLSQEEDNMYLKEYKIAVLWLMICITSPFLLQMGAYQRARHLRIMYSTEETFRKPLKVIRLTVYLLSEVLIIHFL